MNTRWPVPLLVLCIGLVTIAPGCKKRPTIVPPSSGPAADGGPGGRGWAPAPQFQLFSAAPELVDPGQAVTLSWSVNHATRVDIEGVGQFPAEGSTAVHPERSISYVAVATGPGGQARATARVTVTEAGGGVDPGPGGVGVGGSGRIEDMNLTEAQVFQAEVGDIFFDFDRYELSPQARETLRRTAEVLLRRLPNAHIIIEGHCDERGTAEYNLALGDRRANAARDFLVGLGVPVSRIRTISYGEEKPFDPRSNEEAWAKNRRAHFVLVQ